MRNGVKVLSRTADGGCEFLELAIPERIFDAVVCQLLERAESARVNTGTLRRLRALLDSIKPAAKEVMLEN